MTGQVADATGGILPGVAVTAVHQQSQRQQKAVTNELGEYLIIGIAVGDYTLTAELPGFKKSTVRGIKVDVEQAVRVNIKMQIGEIQEIVEVQGG